MKQFFKLAMSLMLMLALLPTLASCNKKAQEPEMSEDVRQLDGSKLVEINDYKLKYDDKDRLSQIIYYSEAYTFDYKKGLLIANDIDDNFSIEFNDKGFLTKMSQKWEEIDQEERIRRSCKGEIDYGYNENGNLICVNTTSSESTTYFDDELGQGSQNKIDVVASIKSELSWINGNLVSVVNTFTLKHPLGMDRESSTINFKYGGQVNKYLQLPMNIAQLCSLGDQLSVMAAVGMFGFGPVNLPVSVSHNYEGMDFEEDINIEQTSHGLINSEICNGSTINWVYGSSSRSDVPISKIATKTPLMKRMIEKQIDAIKSHSIK